MDKGEAFGWLRLGFLGICLGAVVGAFVGVAAGWLFFELLVVE